MPNRGHRRYTGVLLATDVFTGRTAIHVVQSQAKRDAGEVVLCSVKAQELIRDISPQTRPGWEYGRFCP
jgi:hypothetical protein